MTHNLKTLPIYFDAVKSGKKTFEIRSNDRDFKVGDIMILNKWDGKYIDEDVIKLKITYILDSKIYIQPGYVAIGFEKM